MADAASRTNEPERVRAGVCVPRSLAQSTRGQRAAAGGEQVFQQQTTKSLTDIDCMEAVMALPRNNSPSISTHSVRGGSRTLPVCGGVGGVRGGVGRVREAQEEKGPWRAPSCFILLSSPLSRLTQNVAVLSCARRGGVTVAGGGRMLCSLRSQVLKTVYSLYGITKTKKNKLAPLFFVATRDMTTRPGRVPRRVQVRTHLTLGMRAHWGCGHTGDARRRARARGNRVVFCGHAQRNNRRQGNQAIDSVCSGACEASSS